MAADPQLLVITPDFPPAPGGIQLLIHRVVRHLQGFDIRVVTIDSPGAAAFDRAEAFPVVRVGSRLPVHRGRVAALNAAAIADGWRHRPEAVLAGHIVGAPAAAVIKAATGAKMVLYLHAKELGTKPGLARFAVRAADVCICVSRHTERLALAAGAEQERIRRITPGVDLPEDGADRRPGEGPLIVTIARLDDRHKGHDVMARALPLVASHVPNVQWVVIGDGRLRGQTEELVSSLGVRDRTRFVGSVSDEERDDWLRRASVFAMPSRLPGGGVGGEGFGIVYLEANAFGVPVVGGNVGGAVDAVEHGRTALLVDPTDHVAVADAITQLLCDDERARAYGRAGAERARAYTWPRIGERVSHAIRDTIDG